jgi:hypothetical protein
VLFYMSRFRLVFLLSVALMASGYKFRCWWMCQDQTAIQNDYVEQRDRCRQYAQLKLDMAMRSAGERDAPQSRNARLISLFSDCMAQNGWNTTDLKAAAPVSPLATPGTAANKPAENAPMALAGQAPESPPPATKATPQEDKAFVARKSECAFARQSASVSSLAATRAKACDLECTQRLQMAPDAPRPAACPSGPVSGLESGGERTY